MLTRCRYILVEKVAYVVPTEVLLVIPAYNEAPSIADVVTEARLAYPDCDILGDRRWLTRRHGGQKAQSAGAMALTLCCNLGIGGAVRAGYKFGYEDGIRDGSPHRCGMANTIPDNCETCSI